ncbi:MAG: hypothetical protein JOZ62_00700 [Acidobacteriaceae bacterium]|nr:hypothetical protein [Acidobacteriaceae bacterium]
MLARLVLIGAAVAQLAASGDESTLLRIREHMLERAIAGKNKPLLLALTGKGFNADFQANFDDYFLYRESLKREEWIHRLLHLHLDSYEIVVLKIQIPKPDQAAVVVDEYWGIHSPRGTRIQKRFHTSDAWHKSDGVWKLDLRLSVESEPGTK